MRATKNSGFEWIGEIPTSWELYKGKYMFTQRNLRGNTIELQLLSPTQKYGVVPQSVYEDRSGMNAVKLNENANLSALKTIHKGDFCISLRSFQGGFEYSEYEGVVSPAYQVFYPVVKVARGYYKYLFKDSGFIEKMNSYTMTLRDGKNIAFADFGNTYIPCPPVDEQQHIADFLDAKCAEIDALTADIQAQIDTLEQYKRSIITETVTKGLDPNAEMKDSGVFYMAPMNATWRLTKIGYICSKLSRSFAPEETALICSNKGKVQVRADDLTGIMVSDDNAMQGIRSGDIAIHGMDTWHGAIALSEYDGKITRVVHVCDSTEDKRFIVYYMQHLAFQGVYKLISNGVRGNTSDFRSWDKVRNIWIAIPETKEEQAAICDYLDSQCTTVEEVIATKKEQLEVLGEYKKSLIFEYVTGKKEVI